MGGATGALSMKVGILYWVCHADINYGGWGGGRGAGGEGWVVPCGIVVRVLD